MREFVEDALDEVAFRIRERSRRRAGMRMDFGGIAGVVPGQFRLSMNLSALMALSPIVESGSAVSINNGVQARSWACPSMRV